jgi:hypothetical protein
MTPKSLLMMTRTRDSTEITPFNFAMVSSRSRFPASPSPASPVDPDDAVLGAAASFPWKRSPSPASPCSNPRRHARASKIHARSGIWLPFSENWQPYPGSGVDLEAWITNESRDRG